MTVLSKHPDMEYSKNMNQNQKPTPSNRGAVIHICSGHLGETKGKAKPKHVAMGISSFSIWTLAAW